jgi:hypothetical protein
MNLTELSQSSAMLTVCIINFVFVFNILVMFSFLLHVPEWVESKAVPLSQCMRQGGGEEETAATNS